MQDGLQGADCQRAMQGDGYSFAGFHQSHVGATLPGHGEAVPLESLDNCGPGKIAGELQAGTRIGSLMKWRRMR